MMSGMWPAGRLDAEAEAAFFEGVYAAGRFFKGQADVQKALEKLVAVLVPGGRARRAHGALR